MIVVDRPCLTLSCRPRGAPHASDNARSERMRKKTASIQKRTYGQQDWVYTGSR